MAGVERYFTDSVLDAISRYAPPEGGPEQLIDICCL